MLGARRFNEAVLICFSVTFAHGQQSPLLALPQISQAARPLALTQTEYRLKAGEAVMISATTETLAFMRKAKTVNVRVDGKDRSGFAIGPNLKGEIVLAGSLRIKPGKYQVDLTAIAATGESRAVGLNVVLDPIQTVPSSATIPPVVLLNGYQVLGCLAENLGQCASTCPISSGSADTFGSLQTQLLTARVPAVFFFDNCKEDANASIEQLGSDLQAFLQLIKYDNGQEVPYVDLVGHSMGGLIARAYLEGLQANGGGNYSPPLSLQVRKLIQIATPNFGSFQAQTLESLLGGLSAQTAELTPGSAFLWNLATWNQWGDDLRGVDALAIIGNAGMLGTISNATDGVVSLTSASLGFARGPSRTRILPYCHVNSGDLDLIFNAVECAGAGIANVDEAPETGQIVLSFLADTQLWTTIGTTPIQPGLLSQYGGFYTTLRNAAGQFLSDLTQVAFGSIALQNGGASDTIYYTDFIAGTGSFKFTSSSLGVVNCGPITAPTGYYDPFRCKYSPIINGVSPLVQGIPGTFIQSGTTITVTGVGFGQQCSTCQVVAYPQNVGLNVSSWTDQAIVASLPSNLTGFFQLVVSEPGAQDFIGVMALPAPLPSLSVSNPQLQFSYSVGGTAPPAQSITVSGSTASGLRTWSAVPSVSTTVPDGVAWIATSASTTSTLMVSIVPTGLAGIMPGVYKGKIIVTGPGVMNSPQTVSVTLTVTASTSTSNVIVTSVTNSASGATGSIAPGEIVTIKGSGLGPTNGVSFVVDVSTGTVDTNLNGTQVAFGGVSAPITYASGTQINAIVPYEIAGQSQVAMQVSYQGAMSASTMLQVASAAPGAFTSNATGVGQVLAANQNGSFNGSTSPATPGSYVTVYFTGGGQTNPPGATGSVTGSILKYLTQNVLATVGGQAAMVTFAGAAPISVDGLDQLNIQLASNTPSGPAEPLVIKVGAIASPSTVTLNVQAPAKITLQSLTLNPTSITSGNSTVGTVTLSSGAPTGGAQVGLSSNNPSAQVPALVTVDAGQASATFTVTTTSAASTQTATITASLGSSTVVASLTVSPSVSVSISFTSYAACCALGITAGPDGALWFTEPNVALIGRTTTSGAISQYSVPNAGTPTWITAGPDGALWFTEQAAGVIGRITTAGVVTTYGVPTIGGQPYGITAGPDGALWFTEANAGKIGRITTTGVAVEYPLPASSFGGALYGITAGPDGALWFTEQFGVIGRSTTAGVITEYPLPIPFSEPWGITAGPDGALWFADLNNKIWRTALTEN